MRLIDADEVILHLNDFMLQQSPIDVQDIESIKVSAVIQDCIKAIENQPTAYDIEHKCKDCAGCTQWKCDTANVIQEYKENFVKQLEIVKQKHKIEMQKEENETDFYSDCIVSEEHGYIIGLQEAIEIVKGGGMND